MALLLAATWACSVPRADVVPIDMSASFNADLVVNDGSGMNDPTQDAVDLGLIPTGNYCFMTQSVADAAAIVPQTPDGLPDDAFFASAGLHPDVHLSWSNDDDGLNAWRLASATGSLRLDAPPGMHVELHLFATSGDGDSMIELTPTYDDGVGAPVAYTVPDWFDDPADTASRYVLVNDRDRMQPGSGPGTLFEFSDRNAAAIFGLVLPLDPARNLLAVTLDRTDVDGVLDVFGALLVTVGPPEACCLPDGTCVELDPGECALRAGTALGPGTGCATSACDRPEACCLLDGSCLDLLPDACVDADGTAQGSGSDCAGTPCPGPALPGWAPSGDDRPGVPLRVAKSGVGLLDLSWGLGCSPDALDYTVHGGEIGAFYGHVAILCDTAGALVSATIASEVGNRYFLVVPVTATDEGSHGRDSFGVERPASGAASCLPVQTLGCP